MEDTRSLSDIVSLVSPPRTVWLMAPSGDPTEKTLESVKELLSAGDIIIDCGNSNYRDSMRRAASLKEEGIHFVDVGTSGGIWGLKGGYSLMIGGEKAVVEQLRPIFETLAPDPRKGWGHVGPCGAGHFVKMVHNGIEYGMMEAYGEGFHILEASPYVDSLDYAKLAHLWNQGSVIRSWLLELAESAFLRDNKLSGIRGYVEDSGEGRWALREAVDTGVSVPVIALSLMRRFQSREKDAFSDKVVAALRREFGGHAVVSAKEKT